MTDQLRDVHTFDGVLRGIYTGPKWPLEKKREVVGTLLATYQHPHALSCLRRIMADLYTPGGGANYHAANDVDSTDVLVDLLTPFDPAILGPLEEQLVDIETLGQCDSGRVTRIIQLWLAFKVPSEGLASPASGKPLGILSDEQTDALSGILQGDLINTEVIFDPTDEVQETEPATAAPKTSHSMTLRSHGSADGVTDSTI